MAFAASRITDAVRHQYCKFLIENEKYQELTDVSALCLTGRTAGVTSENCRKFAGRYSVKSFERRLPQICNQLVEFQALQPVTILND